MRLLINTDNLGLWFADRQRFFRSRAPAYAEDVTRIHALTVSGRAEDVERLLYYLRPWNIEQEGNWGGRELVRLIAMEGLCFLAVQVPSISTFLAEQLASGAPEWASYDEALREVWSKWTDSSCLTDPHADFLRCLLEVVSCAKSPGVATVQISPAKAGQIPVGIRREAPGRRRGRFRRTEE